MITDPVGFAIGRLSQVKTEMLLGFGNREAASNPAGALPWDGEEDQSLRRELRKEILKVKNRNDRDFHDFAIQVIRQRSWWLEDVGSLLGHVPRGGTAEGVHALGSGTQGKRSVFDRNVGYS